MKKLPILLAAVALQACMSLSVKGQVQNSAETFTGAVTGGISGAGSLTLVSSQGTACEGKYDASTYHQGKGVFKCTDGRDGSFEFVANGSSGTGQGTIGDRTFTFTFGF